MKSLHKTPIRFSTHIAVCLKKCLVKPKSNQAVRNRQKVKGWFYIGHWAEQDCWTRFRERSMPGSDKFRRDHDERSGWPDWSCSEWFRNPPCGKESYPAEKQLQIIVVQLLAFYKNLFIIVLFVYLRWF